MKKNYYVFCIDMLLIIEISIRNFLIFSSTVSSSWTFKSFHYWCRCYCWWINHKRKKKERIIHHTLGNLNKQIINQRIYEIFILFPFTYPPLHCSAAESIRNDWRWCWLKHTIHANHNKMWINEHGTWISVLSIFLVCLTFKQNAYILYVQ